MDRIGRYLVAERLGSGAFATVYRAEDPILELPVAIKVLADNAAGDPDLRSRFINEARVMRRMNSARIATVYDIAELPDGRPYLVMRLAGRGTLYDRLTAVRAHGTPITPADLKALVHGLGDALTVIHKAGVVHRDVKPSNVLIDIAPGGGAPDQNGQGHLVRRDEFLMLADFGIAKTLADTRRLTIIAGTAAYMAPEQRVVGAPIDGRADIYAASAMVAELLELTKPDEPRASGVLHAAVGRGLAEDPDARQADARAWATELTTALTPPKPTLTPTPTLRPTAAEPPPGWPPEAESTPSLPVRGPRRWRRMLAAGLGLLLLAGALTGAAWYWWPGDSGPDIVGPRELTINQQGVYYADAEDGTSITWQRPDGEEQRGGHLKVSSARAGTLMIKVLTSEGAESSTEVDVVAPDSPSVGVFGPVSAELDQEVTLRARVPAGTMTHWIDWNGQRRDSEELVVRVTRPGVLTVRLVAELDDGAHEATHTVTVLP